MNPLFFSVVVPALNEEKYISKLLLSLGKQTYRNFEVILVDGNSRDKTIEIFNKYKKFFPKFLLIKSDKANVGYQRNLGSNASTGEYLVFLDADTNIDSTFLEELHINALKKKFEFATTWIKPDTNKKSDRLYLLLCNFLLEIAKVSGKQFSGGYNTIILKDTFKKLEGFREDVSIGEDHDLAIRAQNKGIEVVILKEPQVEFSLRRIRSYGIMPILRKYIISWIHSFVNIPITDALFYPMGGHVHNKKLKTQNSLPRRQAGKVKKYLKEINRLQNQFINLFKE